MKKLLLALATIVTLLAAGEGRARADREPFLDFGGFVGVHFFSGNNELGRDEPSPTGLAPEHGLIFGPRLSLAFNRWLSGEGEGALIPTYSRDGAVDTLLAFHYRGHLLLHLMQGRVRPFVLVGGGGMWLFRTSSPKIIHNDTDGVFYTGLGVKWDAGDTWGIRLDGRVLLPPTTQVGAFVTTDFEVLAGVYARFGAIRNLPPPPPPVPSDRDHDGIIDDLDRCPDQPEDKDGFEDEDGCPDPDNDGDGILDGDDKCPNEKGPKENSGCPDKDQDGDGIIDRLDKCPKEPETKNGFEDEDGCPDVIPEAVKKYTGVIKGINFKLNSDVITKNSYQTLDEAAKVLTEYPSIKLEIQGHTDSTGTLEHNMDLSQRRAESVRKYFVGKGVAEDRLTAKGYGPEKPIAPNKQKVDRAKNRRVEFVIQQ